MTNTVPVVTYYPGYSQVQVKENLQWRTIASITNANPMVVTTVNDHGYVPGMMARFQIPTAFGMQQLNNVNAQVLAVTNDTLTVNVDSTNYGIFAYPSPLPNAYTPPVVIPNSSGAYLAPQPLPYGNENSFENVIFNDGVV